MADAEKTVLGRAAAFLESHARALEQRRFEALFRGGDPEAVRDALRAYRNPDGGYGLALESDVRAPSSQPLFAHVALSVLREAGLDAAEEAAGLCAYLAAVADERGALSYLRPDAMEHARAGHWSGDFALAPALHATAGILAGLHALAAAHPWLDRATAWCVEQIAGEPAYTGHTILNVLDFLASLPAASRPDGAWERVTGRLFEADYVLMDTPIRTYGLTPLHFAPKPDAPLRGMFSGDVIEAHLDELAGSQQDDGGWPIRWSPPAGAATAEWRGVWTLGAVRILRAYGRI